MNQRFRNEDIRRISEQYADNELYKAICTIGAQLESELAEFGLCPEECFEETLEVLTFLADKGEEAVPELDTLWHRKFNEYRRFDRKVDEGELCKVVGIVFGFTVLAVDSCSHRFYRRTLAEALTMTVANHKFDGWSATLSLIYSVSLPDGWFDDFMGFNETASVREPAVLFTDEAVELWEKLREAGYVNTDCKPIITHSNSQNKFAVIASVMGGKLCLNPLWKPFEDLWGMKDMANKLSQAQIAKYYSGFRKEIEKTLESKSNHR